MHRRSLCPLGLLGAFAALAACSSAKEAPTEAPTVAEVVEATSSMGSYAYGYDPSGQVASVGNGSTTFTIVKSGDVLTAGKDTYHVDALGRTIAVDDLAITYGPDGQIAKATRGAHTTSYVYDESGQRILKSVDGIATSAFLEEGYLTATELDEPVRIGGELVGYLHNGQFALLATDRRGTVQADTDGTPRLASPYGARPVHPNVASALDYTEKGFDPDLGTDRMGVRDYDAQIARFLEPDPLFLVQPEKCIANPYECNLFGYARGQPIDRIDPTGLETIVLHGGLVGSLADLKAFKSTVAALFPSTSIVAPSDIHGGLMRQDPTPAIEFAKTFVHTESQRNLVGWSLGADAAAMEAGKNGPAGGGKWDYVVMVGVRVDRLIDNLDRIMKNAEHVVIVNMPGDHYSGPAGWNAGFGDRSSQTLDAELTTRYGSVENFLRGHPNVSIRNGDREGHVGASERPAQTRAMSDAVHEQEGHAP